MAGRFCGQMASQRAAACATLLVVAGFGVACTADDSSLALQDSDAETRQDAGSRGGGGGALEGGPRDAVGTVADAPLVDAGADAAQSDDGAAPGESPDGGPPVAHFDATLDFGTIACASAISKAFVIDNLGAQPLVVSASTTGDAFSVTPTTLSVAPGGSGTVTVTATIAQERAAGAPLAGSLNLFTNDRTHASPTVTLSAIPRGGSLALDVGSPASASFGTAPVGVAATPLVITFVNSGNAPETVSLSKVADGHFTLVPTPANGATLAPGERWQVNAGFTPSNTAPVSAKTLITLGGVTCGGASQTLSLSGLGSKGDLQGWPSSLDFGPADCGSVKSKRLTFTLTNRGPADAHVTGVSFDPKLGFSTALAVGQTVPAGGSLLVGVAAPAIETTIGSVAPLVSTLSITTDSEATPHAIQLQETPNGAILSFDTTQAATFGSFGSVVLLQSSSQTVDVSNGGNASATITLMTTDTPLNAGTGAAGDAAVHDAGLAAPALPSFHVPSETFAVAPQGSQQASVSFAPVRANVQTGALSMAVSGPLCAPLPGALALSGNGVGGGLSVEPRSLVFGATCGEGAPAPQQFTVVNDGTLDLTWHLSEPTGPGASFYTVTATPDPGLLRPGGRSTVVVTARPVPSPSPLLDPASFAASVTLTTDVPFDDPRVVSLGETPLGDQLAWSVDGLRFGQFPVGGTSAGQSFTLVNRANPGSPPAHLALALSPSESPYALSPAAVPDLPPGGASPAAETVTFAPTEASASPASLAITTSDALCSKVPPPLVLTGTGTLGQVNVSASTLAFGSDPGDPRGLVDCGGTGLPRTLTVSNGGNQAVTVTGITLGKGGSSPYTLSGPGSSSPVALPIAGSTTFTVTPTPIPALVTNPSDAAPFGDTLSIATDVPGSAPLLVTLTMQARGAVIDDTPVASSWTFGPLGAGSIATFTTAIRNTGNAGATVALTGVAQPLIFGLATSPTVVAESGVSSVVGQFIPPSANGSWSDQGTLAVTAPALCAPLPLQWAGTVVRLSGTSNGASATSEARPNVATRTLP